MKISARVESSKGSHSVSVGTNGNVRALVIPPKTSGSGSSVNGGELLFLALATCYCNDIYREAAKRGISISSVEVDVTGEFGAEGEPARNVEYRANVRGGASDVPLRELMLETDRVAEIQNTLRSATPVRLARAETVSETL